MVSYHCSERLGDRMAESEDDPSAVLAFLLGSAPSLDATDKTDSNASVVDTSDDTPELEPVSDSDVEETNATAGPASDWDAAACCESQDEVAKELQRYETPIVAEEGEEMEEVREQKCNMEAKDNSVSEAENEDDCASPTPTSEVEMEDKSLQKQKCTSGALVVNSTKTRRGTGETRAAAVVSKVAMDNKKKNGPVGNDPTLEELIFVICVATMLVAYLVACVYSFFHPLSVPLPDYEGLYSAYDISNVSVQIVNPVENSMITPQGVSFEWKLVNFPVEALHLYGAEVFRYQLSIDDEVVASEVGFLSLDDEEGEKPPGNTAEILNRTVQLPIPRRRFDRDDGKPFKLHLQVTIPIPGLIGELKSYEQVVFVGNEPNASPEDGVQLTLTSPADGATFVEGQSFVVEYTAVNVQEMHVYLDNNVYFKKTHVSDGNLFVRGLGARPHTLEIKALDERGEIVASSAVHINVVERPDAKTT